MEVFGYGVRWATGRAMLLDKAKADQFAADHSGLVYALVTKAAASVEIGALQAEIERLRVALRFYANGEHYHADEAEEFDTVSGEPQNWLASGREDSSTMIENGQIARHALLGKAIDWKDGDNDHTPKPIEGESSWSGHVQVEAKPALIAKAGAVFTNCIAFDNRTSEVVITDRAKIEATFASDQEGGAA